MCAYRSSIDLLAVCLAGFVLFVFSIEKVFADDKPAGIIYWAEERKSPEKSRDVVLDAIIAEDYSKLYSFISHGAIFDLKRVVSTAGNEVWGVPVDLFNILMSDFGYRYGLQAIFEKVMRAASKDSESWVSKIQAFGTEGIKGGLPFSVNMQEEKAIFIITVKNDECTFIFVKRKDEWFLEGAQIGSVGWRVGVEKKPQTSD